jgi:hypothetical protein
MISLMALSLLTGLIACSPTIAYLYFLPRVYRFSLAQGWVGIVIAGCYVGLPLLDWHSRRAAADAELQQILSEVQKIPVSTMTGPLPRDISFRSGGTSLAGLECPQKPITSDQLQRLTNLTEKQLLERRKAQKKALAEEAKKPYPPRYLVLETRDEPPIPTKLRATGGGKHTRLSIREYGTERLLGVHFVPHVQKPYDIPLLTLNGWLKKPNVVNINHHWYTDFIKETLAVDCLDLHILPRKPSGI